MKWACLVGLASCTATPTVPTDFELQIDYRLAANATGDYAGSAYAGGDTIDVDLVYPDLATALDDHSHVVTFAMGSAELDMIVAPRCLGAENASYREVDTYQVSWDAGSATPDISGRGACYGSGVVEWTD